MAYGFRAIIRIIAITVVSAHGISAAAAGYGEALEFLRAGSFQKAHSQFSTLAEKGDTNAQFQLGLMAHLGHGIPQNFSDARNWYHRAAKAGEARSQNNLGVIYRDGLGISPDTVRAYKWFSLAASQRNEQAIKNLRMLLHDMDKAEILNGQQLAQKHYDEVKNVDKNIKSASIKSNSLPDRDKAKNPKLLKPNNETDEVVAKTVGFESSLIRILKTIIGPSIVVNPNNSIPVSENNPDVTLVNVPKTITDQATRGKFFVQLGLFKNANNVKRIYEKLKDRGIIVVTEKISLGGNRYNKLRVGPYPNKGRAVKMSEFVNRILGIRSLVVYQGTSNQVEATSPKRGHL